MLHLTTSYLTRALAYYLIHDVVAFHYFSTIYSPITVIPNPLLWWWVGIMNGVDQGRMPFRRGICLIWEAVTEILPCLDPLLCPTSYQPGRVAGEAVDKLQLCILFMIAATDLTSPTSN